jgi:hypothetical protein
MILKHQKNKASDKNQNSEIGNDKVYLQLIRKNFNVFRKIVFICDKSKFKKFISCIQVLNIYLNSKSLIKYKN